MESFYIGGHVPDPAYREVCDGATGHAKAIWLVLDPSVVSFEEVLDISFGIRDPT